MYHGWLYIRPDIHIELPVGEVFSREENVSLKTRIIPRILRSIQAEGEYIYHLNYLI
jgi:hypothetical protein